MAILQSVLQHAQCRKIIVSSMPKTIPLIFYIESLLADIVKNVHVKDTLARQLDQPLCHGGREVPIIQYWPHLAEEFKVSEDVRIKCQHNIENSPTKHMFEFLEAQAPNFSVSDLKVGLKGISRKDLVKRLEQCYLLGEFPFPCTVNS